MRDNLRTNQVCFKKYKYTSGSNDEFSCKHPVSNDQFDFVFLLNVPSHLLKTSEIIGTRKKCKNLSVDPEDRKTVKARWSDLVELYRSEEHSIVKSTRLNYATLYRTNFEKQSFISNCNEKTVTALFQH